MGAPSVSNPGLNSGLSRAETRKANPENFNVIIDGRMMREPRRLIYLHSVAKREFRVSHTLFPYLIIKGCMAGERYVTAATIPDPIPQVCPDQERGGRRVDEHDGWRSCIDLLNPNNPTNDPYWNNAAGVPAYMGTSTGCDLISQGVWPSLNKIPPEAEIKRAEKARDDRYRAMTQNAIRLASKSRRELNEYLQEHPDVHEAMDSLGLKADWHQTAEVKISCPNCGDEIKQGLAFHQSSAGIMCIIDPERALKAGAIDRAKYESLTETDEPRRGPGRPPRNP